MEHIVVLDSRALLLLVEHQGAAGVAVLCLFRSVQIYHVLHKIRSLLFLKMY